MQSPAGERFYSRQQAAEQLGISVDQVRRAQRAGELVGEKDINGAWRYRGRVLEAYRERRRRECNRSEVCRRLSCSYAQLGRLEAVAGVRPRRAGRSYLYSDEDVEQLERAARRLRGDAGHVASLAFAAFREGRSVVDVVIEAQIPPADARDLWREYHAPTGRALEGEHVVELDRCARRALGRSLGEGPRSWAEDLVALLGELTAAQERDLARGLAAAVQTSTQGDG